MRIIKRTDFFDDFLSNLFRTDYTDLAKTDIYETEGNLFIEIEVPGLKRENIKVELNQGYLEVRTVLDEKAEDSSEKPKYHLRQRRSIECARKYKLDEGVTEKDVKVKLEDGLLKIQVAKPEKAIPVTKTIEIE